MDRIATGVRGLDLVLCGGVPVGSLVMFAGGPGTGKTILAEQICFAVGSADRKAIYYTTLAEPHDKLVRYLEMFDFFDQEALEERVEFLNLGDLLMGEAEQQGENPLGPLVSEVVRACFERQPAVIVIDSIKALRDFVDEGALRRMLYDLASRVAHSQSVVLCLGEYAEEEIERAPEFSLADGIIYFAYQSREPVDRRWVRVTKLRGSRPLTGKHSFDIGPGGITVHPRLETVDIESRPQPAVRIKSGVPRLDEMMGGGIRAGDATAILGPSGCGKTIACLRFIMEGVEQGEQGLYVSFQESTAQLDLKAASFGWDMAAARASGSVAIHHVAPADLDLDRLGSAVREHLAGGSLRRVVVDSLGELVFAARETDRFPAFARALTGAVRARGATALITSETTTLGPTAEPLSHLSFLFQNVILLRYIEIESETRRAISVLKMRDSSHEHGIRQFTIDAHGITIGDQLKGLTGVLGWGPLREEQAQPGLRSGL